MIKLTGISKMTGVNKITFATGGGGPTLVDLDFPVVTNWQESPANSWSPITGHNGEGRTNKYIPAGQAGYIQAEFDGSINTMNTAIILDPSNSIATPYYDTCIYGLYVNSSNHYALAENGSYTDTGVTASAGHLFRIYTDGVTVSAEYSTNSGSTWIPLHDYGTSAVDLFLMGSSADPGWQVFLKNPKGYNIN